MIRILALSSFLVLAISALAEPPNPRPGDIPPPPNGGPPPPRGDRDHDRDRGDRGDWRGGGLPGFGRPPGRNDGFDKLPEDEKKRVREALDKVWSRPEVIEARDVAMKANEDFRDAIRNALKAIDPEVIDMMDRVRPPDHFDVRQMPKLPPADSNEFPRVALERMGLELLAYARPERREEAKKLHERIVAMPHIQEAIAKVQNTRGEDRIQAMQALRESYRDEVTKEFKAARERRAAQDKDRDRGKDGDRDKERGKDKPGPPSL